MHPNTARQPKRALIVEDNPTSAQLTTLQLQTPTGEAAGADYTSCCVHGQWEVTWAESLGMACEYLKQNEYDVVILDLILGDGEKEDAVTVIRETAPDVCIVVQSSLTDAALVKKLINSNAVSDYIVKGTVNAPLTLKQRLCHALDVFYLRRDIELTREQCGLAQSG